MDATSDTSKRFLERGATIRDSLVGAPVPRSATTSRRSCRSGRLARVELDDLLNAMDRAAANLAKLEGVWHRAQSFIPT
jgi:hypothetical protein